MIRLNMKWFSVSKNGVQHGNATQFINNKQQLTVTDRRREFWPVKKKRVDRVIAIANKKKDSDRPKTKMKTEKQKKTYRG